jgi:UDP-N-acetylglucosamine--N-acetylmuramyl-(pentapeptide) pyrophosphoryl-undecaprenol N-acetylglucosamine transferase
VYLHESDSVPGLANTLLSKICRGVFTSFVSSNSSFGAKALLVGNPVRTELLSGNHSEALSFFRFSPERKTMLIQGGSQGSQEMNAIILNGLVVLSQHYQIIHQCGDSQYATVKAEMDRDAKEGGSKYGTNITQNYRLYPFLNTQEQTMAYAAADVIVSRAGAGSIFEIAQLGKPAIFIPLALAAGNHQLKNAIEIAKFGAIIIEGTNMTAGVLMNQIEELLKPDVAARISQSIKQFATPDAASRIATALLQN